MPEGFDWIQDYKPSKSVAEPPKLGAVKIDDNDYENELKAQFLHQFAKAAKYEIDLRDDIREAMKVGDKKKAKELTEKAVSAKQRAGSHKPFAQPLEDHIQEWSKAINEGGQFEIAQSAFVVGLNKIPGALARLTGIYDENEYQTVMAAMAGTDSPRTRVTSEFVGRMADPTFFKMIGGAKVAHEAIAAKQAAAATTTLTSLLSKKMGEEAARKAAEKTVQAAIYEVAGVTAGAARSFAEGLAEGDVTTALKQMAADIPVDLVMGSLGFLGSGSKAIRQSQEPQMPHLEQVPVPDRLPEEASASMPVKPEDILPPDPYSGPGVRPEEIMPPGYVPGGKGDPARQIIKDPEGSLQPRTEKPVEADQPTLQSREGQQIDPVDPVRPLDSLIESAPSELGIGVRQQIHEVNTRLDQLADPSPDASAYADLPRSVKGRSEAIDHLLDQRDKLYNKLPEAVIKDANLPSSTVKSAIRQQQVAWRPTGEKLLDQPAALRLSLRAQAKGARFGYRQAADEYRARIRDIKTAARNKAADQAAIRKAVTELAMQAPKPVRAEMLNAVRDAQTPITANKAIEKLEKLIDRHEHKQAVKELKAAAKKTNINTMAPGAKRKLVQALAEADSANLLTNYSKDAVAQLKQLSYKQAEALTTQQAQRLSDALNQATRVSKKAQKIIKTRKAREVEQSAEAIESTLSSRKDRRSASVRVPRSGKARTFLVEGQDKPDTLAMAMDGGQPGAITKALVDEPNAGVRESYRIKQSGMEHAKAVVRAVTGLDWGSKNLANWLKEEVDLNGVTVTRSEVANFIANLLDPHTRQELIRSGAVLGRNKKKIPVDDTTIGKLLQEFEPEFRLAHNLRDWMAKVGAPELNKTYRSEYGHDIANNAGYWPSRRSLDETPVQLEIDDIKGFTNKTLESMGMLKARVGGNQPFVIDDILSVYERHVRGTAGVVGLLPVARKYINTLNHPRVSKTMDNKFGSQRREFFKQRMRAMVEEHTGRYFEQGPQAGVAGKLIENIAKGALGANPFVVLKQPVSILMASAEMPLLPLLKASAELRGPAGTAFNETLAKMKQYSPVLWARSEAPRLHLIGMLGSESPVAGRRGFGDKMMGGIAKADEFAVATVWKAQENLQAKNHKVGSPEYWDAVAKETERVVNKTQPVFDTVHQSWVGLESRRTPLAKLATMFMSQRNQNYNILKRAIVSGSPKAAAYAAGLATVNQLIMMLIDDSRSMAYGYEPESDASKKAAQWATGILSNIYGGEYANELVKGAFAVAAGETARVRPVENPVAGTATDLMSGLVKTIEGATADPNARFKSGPRKGRLKADAKFWEGIEKSFLSGMSLGGMPVSSPYKLMRGLATGGPNN